MVVVFGSALFQEDRAATRRTGFDETSSHRGMVEPNGPVARVYTMSITSIFETSVHRYRSQRPGKRYAVVLAGTVVGVLLLISGVVATHQQAATVLPPQPTTPTVATQPPKTNGLAERNDSPADSEFRKSSETSITATKASTTSTVTSESTVSSETTVPTSTMAPDEKESEVNESEAESAEANTTANRTMIGDSVAAAKPAATDKPDTTAKPTTSRKTTSSKLAISNKLAVATRPTTLNRLNSPAEADASERVTTTQLQPTSKAVPAPTKPPAPTPVGRPSTDNVINQNDPDVLFYSNNDSCRSIQNSQIHPDWVEGQPNSSRNPDGSPTYGFAYNTGDEADGDISWSFKESSLALSGRCVLAMGVNDAYSEARAVRIFRRYDQNGEKFPDEAYYSVWFYFPQEVTFASKATINGSTQYGFWNVFQIKDRVNGDSLSTFSINAGKVAGDDGSMSFSIWANPRCGSVESCSSSHHIYQEEPIAIPTKEWVHLEMFHKASTGSDGRVAVWQNGRKIIDFAGVTERIGSTVRNWSVNNYGRLHTPASHELFVDDVLISTKPIHPKLFD